MFAYREVDLDPPAPPIASGDAAIEALLQKRWNELLQLLGSDADRFLHPLTTRFPGLTPKQTIKHYSALTVVSHDEVPLGGRLALVPSAHPADSIAQLGWNGPEDAIPVEIAAVLRSWERRLGVYPVSVGLGDLDVVIERPPSILDDQHRWLAEQLALNSNSFLEFESLIQATVVASEPILRFRW